MNTLDSGDRTFISWCSIILASLEVLHGNGGAAVALVYIALIAR